jgi:hypothetical protein
MVKKTKMRLVNSYNGKLLIFDKLSNLDLAAGMAFDLLSKWGMVAAVDNGEDSSGRAKVRLSTPEEVVERAVKTAELFLRVADERGWICTVSDEMEAELEKSQAEPYPRE